MKEKNRVEHGHNTYVLFRLKCEEHCKRMRVSHATKVMRRWLLTKWNHKANYKTWFESHLGKKIKLVRLQKIDDHQSFRKLKFQNWKKTVETCKKSSKIIKIAVGCNVPPVSFLTIRGLISINRSLFGFSVECISWLHLPLYASCDPKRGDQVVILSRYTRWLFLQLVALHSSMRWNVVFVSCLIKASFFATWTSSLYFLKHLDVLYWKMGSCATNLHALANDEATDAL